MSGRTLSREETGILVFGFGAGSLQQRLFGYDHPLWVVVVVGVVTLAVGAWMIWGRE